MIRFLRQTGLDLRAMVVRAVLAIRRTQPGPALIRLVAGLAAMAALVVAAPSTVAHTGQIGLLVPFAVGVALAPRTRFVTFVIVIAVLLWLLTTFSGDGEPTLGRVGLLAALLYVTHSASALAAVLPYDASVGREVLLRWAIRVITSTVVAVGIGLAGMAVFQQLPTQRSAIGPMIGAGVAALLVGVLALQVRRR
jgi:hypothetical protein